MDKLLTKKDLSARWQVTEKAIDNWCKEGLITPVKGIPSIRFSPEHIAEIEGVQLERFSPLERRKFEKENEELKKENQRFKEILSRIFS